MSYTPSSINHTLTTRINELNNLYKSKDRKGLLKFAEKRSIEIPKRSMLITIYSKISAFLMSKSQELMAKAIKPKLPEISKEEYKQLKGQLGVVPNNQPPTETLHINIGFYTFKGENWKPMNDRYWFVYTNLKTKQYDLLKKYEGQFLDEIDGEKHKNPDQYIIRNILDRNVGFRDSMRVFDSANPIIKIRQIIIGKPPADINPEAIHWTDDAHVFINHKYMFNNVNLEGKFISNYQSNYVKRNYKEKACLYSLLIDMLYDYWYLASPLTYNFLFERIHNRKPTPIDSWALTFNQILPFLTHYRIEFHAHNLDGMILWEYVPEKPNKKLIIIHCLGHNNHLYRPDLSNKQLAERQGIKKSANFVSSHYYISKNKNNLQYELIDDLKDLTKYITRDRKLKDNGGTPHQTNLYINDIDKLIQELMTVEKYEPKIKLSANCSLDSIHIKTDANTYSVRKVSFDTCPELKFKNNEHLSMFMEAKDELYASLINLNTKSVYSQNVRHAIDIYTNHSLSGRLSQNNWNVYFDFRKCYLSKLLKPIKIPVLTKFDEYSPYMNQKIKNYNMYIIRTQEPVNKIDLIVTDCKIQRVYGLYVNYLRDNNISCEILGVLSPMKFVDVDIRKLIKKLYESPMDISSKKHIPNIVIGLSGKRKNTGMKAHLFTDIDEARTHFGSNVIQIAGYFVGFKREQKLLEDGFYPIMDLVYNQARIDLHKLAKAASIYGEVIGVKVDAVFIKSNITPFDRPSGRPNKIGDFKITNSTDSSYDTIGTITVNKRGDKNPLRDKQIEYYSNAFDKGIIVTPKQVIATNPTTEHLWETSPEEFNKEIRTLLENRTQILGKYPGVGKTHTAINYDHIDKKEILVVTPHNALKEELVKKHIRAITANRLFGLNHLGEHKKGVFSIKGIKRIVFDEIYLHPVAMLNCISNFMDKHPDIHFLCTGDTFQNTPPGEHYPREYYEYIISTMFPYAIELTIPKRIKDPKEREIYCALFDELKQCDGKPETLIGILRKYNFKFVDKLTELHQDAPSVCYYNLIANKVNQHQHAISKSPIRICKDYFKTSWKNVTGTYRDQDNDGKEYKFFQNTEYTLVSQNKTEVELKDIHDRQIKMKTEWFDKIFKLPYARTGHSLQGLTVGPKVNLFDIVDNNLLTKEWLIPALSRCTTLDIRIYAGELKYNDLRSNVVNMLNGYIEQDKKRGMDPSENITVAETMELLKDPRCTYCHSVLDFEGMSKLTLDRISNHLPHRKNNVTIACLTCNKMKK